MKSVPVCCAVLVVVQCFVLQGQTNFTCDENSLQLSDNIGLLGTDGFHVSQQVRTVAPPGHKLAPRAPSHDLVLGDCLPGDFTDKFNLTACIYPDFLGGNKSEDYTINMSSEDTITCVRVFDTYLNAEGEHLGGYPIVEEGGIGFHYIKFRFDSQEGLGMIFFIDIWYIREPGTGTIPHQ